MLCISEVMPGRYLNNRGYLPAYLPVCLTSVSRHFAVAWQYCCRSVAILLLWRGNLVVVAWQYCCCSVATFRGCSSLCCTNIASDKNLPRNTQNPQNLLADKSLPRISQMYTVFSSPPVVSVCSVNSVGRYFCGCVGMAGMPYPPNLCTSVQSVGVFVGGYGILPYPRRPPRGCSCPSCTNRANRAYPPTEFTEFTEASGCVYSPTDFTDAHRFLGCVFAS